MDLWHGNYMISDDKSLLDEIICGFLVRSYWASQRTRETINKSIDNSVLFVMVSTRANSKSDLHG